MFIVLTEVFKDDGRTMSEVTVKIQLLEVISFVSSWIELEAIMVSEISQKEKGEYKIYLTYKQNLINRDRERKHKVKHGLDKVYCIRARNSGEGLAGKDRRELGGSWCIMKQYSCVNDYTVKDYCFQ